MATVILGNKTRLREKELGDARRDYNWHMDRELARMDASPLLWTSFKEYLSDYAAQLRSPVPSRRIFAILTLDAKHIGNCSYYNINEKRREAELGIMIGDRDYWGKGYGTDAVITLVNNIFLDTKLVQVHLKTLDWNYRAHKCFEKCGFQRCGFLYRDGYSYILMKVERETWLALHFKPIAASISVNRAEEEASDRTAH